MTPLYFPTILSNASRAILIAVTSMIAITASAQDEINMQTGDISMCDGAFFDSGGTAGDYGANENLTLTICPLTEGDVVFVQFLTVGLICPDPNNANTCDFLEVFDGDNAGANPMGTVTGPVTFAASPLNTSGCLTFRFRSSANNESTGWAASVSCETPCERPFAIASSNPGGPSPIKICQGEEVFFDGSASTVAAGSTIDSWEWDFRDGTIDTSGPIVSHVFDEPGEYIVQLYLIDENGCASVNRTDIQIWVATPPNIELNTSVGDFTVCEGQEVCLSIDPTSLGITWDAQPELELGTPLVIPDEIGNPFESPLELNSFSPGQTLDDIADLNFIQVNMEHSFIGDLLIQIVCPDGTTVNMHEQGGGGVNLGDANQADDEVPGVGWDYFWSPTADLGTWAEEAGNGYTMPSATGTSLISDTYSTVGDLADLVGCPLNGVWNLTITDLWNADDGTSSGWTISFNPEIYPELTSFTPTYGIDGDSTAWVGENIIFSDAGQDSICFAIPEPGTSEFSFYTINDFGCEFDTTVYFTVEPPLVPNAGPDVEIQCEQPYTFNPYLENVPFDNCDYELILTDTGFDGWADAEIEVRIDGVSTFYSMAPGLSENYSFTVNHLDDIQIFFDGGTGLDDATEISFVMRDANNSIVAQAGQFGAAPANGLVYSGQALCFPAEPPLNYLWTPSDNLDNPNIENPTVTGLTTSTTFTVSIWEPAHPDCVFTDDVTISIAGALTAGTDTAGCAMSYQMNATPLANGLWTAPAGSGITFSNPTIHNPVVTATTPGTYILTYSDLDGLSCPITDDVEVIFFNGISITESITIPICYDDCNGELEVEGLGGNLDYTGVYIYTFDEGIPGSAPNRVAGLCKGDISVTLTDNNGCESSASFFVDEPNQVQIDSVLTTRESCLGECDGTVRVVSQDATSYSFDGGLTFNTDSLMLNVCGGPVDVVIADNNGCSLSSSTFVPSPVAPEALFAADPVRASLFEPSISFENFSSFNAYNMWNFGTGNSSDTTSVEHPQFLFPAEPGFYEVSLVVTDSIGCTDSLAVEIEIFEEFQFFAPSGFTPNDDGINDVFTFSITDLDPTDYIFQIFDRNGGLVYQSTEYPTQWNGQGIDTPEYYVSNGIYVWRLEARSASTTRRIEKMGTITVVR